MVNTCYHHFILISEYFNHLYISIRSVSQTWITLISCLCKRCFRLWRRLSLPGTVYPPWVLFDANCWTWSRCKVAARTWQYEHVVPFSVRRVVPIVVVQPVREESLGCRCPLVSHSNHWDKCDHFGSMDSVSAFGAGTQGSIPRLGFNIFNLI